MSNERIGILIDDLIEKATLASTPTAVASLPVSFLTHPSRSEAMLVEGDTVTITASFASAQALNCAALCRHSLSSNATVSLELLDADDSLLYSFSPAVKACTVAYFPSVSAHKLRWVITDTGAAQIRIGRAFAGLMWQPEFNVDRGAGLGWEDSSEQIRAQSGTVFFKTRQRFQKNELSFNNLNTQDARIIRSLNMGKGLFMSIYKDWAGSLEGDFEGIYAVTETPKVTHESSDIFVGSMLLIEA